MSNGPKVALGAHVAVLVANLHLLFRVQLPQCIICCINLVQKFENLFAQLGRYKTGASCVYIKKLSDVNETVLRELIKQSFHFMKEKYPS